MSALCTAKGHSSVAYSGFISHPAPCSGRLHFSLKILLQILLIQTKLQIKVILIWINTMYVCLCKAVTQQQIRQAAADGASYADIRKELGVGTDCGCCGQCAKQIVRETSTTAVAACEFSEAC